MLQCSKLLFNQGFVGRENIRTFRYRAKCKARSIVRGPSFFDWQITLSWVFAGADHCRIGVALTQRFGLCFDRQPPLLGGTAFLADYQLYHIVVDMQIC